MPSQLSLGSKMIVIDGVDGAGKGVQSRRLSNALLTADIDTILTREPGGSPAAERIRALLVEGAPEEWDAMTELLLMYAARRAHLRDTIWPALKAGQWVVSDRFADSSRAFQGIAGELGLTNVERMQTLVLGEFRPDLVLILDVPVSIALQRAMARSDKENRFEKKGTAYQSKVRQAFKQIALNNPADYRLIHADQTIEQVSEQIRQTVNQFFRLNLKPGDQA